MDSSIITPEITIPEIADKVEETYLFFEKRLGKQFPRPQIKLSRTLGSTAGRAHGYKLIEINPAFAKNHREELFKRTIIHEAVHCLSLLHFKQNCSHGPKWQMLMRMIGAPTTPCHSYSLQGVVNCDKWGCGLHVIEISAPKSSEFKLLLRKGRHPLCPKCRRKLTPV